MYKAINADELYRKLKSLEFKGDDDFWTGMREMRDDCLEYIAAAPSIYSEKWISLKDELPKKEGNYLVSFPYDAEPQTLHYSTKYQLFNTKSNWTKEESARYGFTYPDILYWMEIPEPIKAPDGYVYRKRGIR